MGWLRYICYSIKTNAQEVYNPVFDRTDIPAFHVEKVILSIDTTFVNCTYIAEAHSWANISKDTYLEDYFSGERFSLLKVYELPFSPEKRHFINNDTIQVILCFPNIHSNKFNIIENENEESFNVYGIDLMHSFENTYTEEDYILYQNLSDSIEKISNTTEMQEKAIYYKTKQLNAGKYLYGIHSIFCASIMYDLCLLNGSNNQYKEAIDWGEKAIEIISDLPYDNREDLARIHSSLMTYYYLNKNYNLAISNGEVCYNYRRELWKDNDTNLKHFAVFSDYIARVCYAAGYYDKALKYEQESSSIFQNCYGELSEDYIQTLSNISAYQHAIGNLKDAIITCQTAISSINQINIDSIPTLRATIYHNYALILSSYGRQNEALEYAFKSLDNIEQSKYIDTFTLIGDIYRHKKEYQKALLYYNKADSIYKINSATDNNINLLIKRGQIYKDELNFEKALYYDSLALNRAEKIYDKESINYAHVLLRYSKESLLNKVFLEKKHYFSIESGIYNAANIIKRYLEDCALNFSPSNLLSYWESTFKHLFDDWIPISCYYLGGNYLNSLCYDALLLYKGFLLNSFMEYNTNNSNNSFLSYSWKDIQNELNDDDIAIEFGCFDYLNDSTLYYALVVEKKESFPKFIKLFEEKELKTIIQDKKVNIEQISKLVWLPLIEHIEEAHNVYFSAAGLLNIIGIEYYNNFDSTNFYRLSSTKEIIKKNTRHCLNNAILYGGLDYRQPIEIKQDNTSEHQYIFVKDILERGGFEPLYNSLDEIKEINELLNQQNIATAIFHGSNGTEESFWNLSKTEVNIIHMATHGMYVNDEDIEQMIKTNNLQFLKLLSDNDGYYNEDIELSHSFLVMAGGNRLIQRDSVITNNNDGFLTAEEISHVIFNNLDLVVLSACESALGNITSEGVYGLQRGFKKAGANTILMSLGKVDDEATKILMVEFYKNLMSGESKHQSLKDAQKHLRKVEKGKYDDPKYWASFIMLDGLN